MPYLRNDADTPGGWSMVGPDGDVRRLDRKYAQFAPMGDGLAGLASTAQVDHLQPSRTASRPG